MYVAYVGLELVTLASIRYNVIVLIFIIGEKFKEHQQKLQYKRI